MVFLCEYWRAYSSSQLGTVSTMHVTAKENCYVLHPGGGLQMIVLEVMKCLPCEATMKKPTVG